MMFSKDEKVSYTCAPYHFLHRAAGRIIFDNMGNKPPNGNSGYFCVSNFSHTDNSFFGSSPVHHTEADTKKSISKSDTYYHIDFYWSFAVSFLGVYRFDNYSSGLRQ